jgi:acyl-CoA synthetase (AMP-forming)/AMP-acid ligase II
VALRPGVDEPHEPCIERPTKYKRPALIEVLDELPGNPVGKIDEPALRAPPAAWPRRSPG